MPAPDHPLHEALFHYYCEFDAIALLHSHVVAGLQPEPGMVINFLGVRIPPKIFPSILDGLAGRVEGPPIPGNWHADIAEWAAALRAVDLAHGTFRIVELGCGWGCWLVNMGAAARARGLAVDLIGIEGDRNHLANATDTLALNGFGGDMVSLHNGIAGPKPGKAIFPDPEAGTAGWGGEAIFYPDDATLRAAEADPTVQVLDCLPLDQVAGGQAIDLLHIDIQGAEADYVKGSLSLLDRHVKRVLIGTHSRAIEGQLCTTFIDAGWRLEMERPMIAPLQNGQQITAIDGVQMWMNPKLTGGPA